MINLLLSKTERYKKALNDLYSERFWAFAQEWWDEIDKAIANDNGDRLKQLYEALKESSLNNPQEFPLWYLLPVPEDIENAFAKNANKSDRTSLHYSLKVMSFAEQEKVVKKVIKFWHKKHPNAVPDLLLDWCNCNQPVVVPHGAIADPVAPLPRVEPIFDRNSFNILLGVDTQKKPLYWTPSQETNGFALVIGASGSGKTESLKAIAHETHSYGIPILIIDFHGDIALDCCKTISLSHTSACEYGINPLELDSLDPVNGGVFPQLQKLIESICAFNSSIGHKQKLNIENYLAQAYKNAGISDQDTNTWVRTPPTFSDVIELMEADIANPDMPMPIRNDISSALSVVRSVFKHPVFSKPNRLDVNSLLTRSHRIDLSPLLGSEDIQFLVVDTLLRKIGCALSAKGHIPVKCSDRERYRLGVFMDEAHKFTSKSTNRKGVIDIYALEYRKYGLVMGLGSQNLDHFSPDTIAQVATKILLKLQSAESAKFPANEFGLSIDAITKGLRGKGHGYLKRGSAEAIEFQFTPMHKR